MPKPLTRRKRISRAITVHEHDASHKRLPRRIARVVALPLHRHDSTIYCDISPVIDASGVCVSRSSNEDRDTAMTTAVPKYFAPTRVARHDPAIEAVR